MKKIAITVLFLGSMVCLNAQQPGLIQLGDVKITFASGNDAQRYLKTEDLFLLNLSPFDRSARLKTNKAVTSPEYIQFITGQTMNWNGGEKDKISAIMQRIITAVSAYNLLFPREIIDYKNIRTGRRERRLLQGQQYHCAAKRICGPARKQIIQGDIS